MRWSRRPAPVFAFEPQERFGGLSMADIITLADYNAERGHGIMHTPEWQAKMAEMQARYDAAEQQRNERIMAELRGRNGR